MPVVFMQADLAGMEELSKLQCLESLQKQVHPYSKQQVRAQDPVAQQMAERLVDEADARHVTDEVFLHDMCANGGA